MEGRIQYLVKIFFKEGSAAQYRIRCNLVRYKKVLESIEDLAEDLREQKQRYGEYSGSVHIECQLFEQEAELKALVT